MGKILAKAVCHSTKSPWYRSRRERGVVSVFALEIGKAFAMCQIIFSLAWNALLHRLASVQLSPGTNEFRWNLHANENFSLDSMYKALILSEIPIENNKMIWKMKIPLKIKIFGWYLCRGVILIKDYLVRRNWQGSIVCFLS
jgi:hypothetical protein